MVSDILMVVKTAAHRYVVRRDELLDVKMTCVGDVFHPIGQPDRPYLCVELGTLLDPTDRSALKRRRALIVPLRRRSVALLVDYVETFLEYADSAPLPALLHKHLRQPWAVGALVIEDELVVQLDLRAVARSAILSKSSES